MAHKISKISGPPEKFGPGTWGTTWTSSQRSWWEIFNFNYPLCYKIKVTDLMYGVDCRIESALVSCIIIFYRPKPNPEKSKHSCL